MSSKKSSISQHGDKILLCDNNYGLKEDELRLFLYYMNIATNLYTWENLPEGLPSWKLEQFLFEHSQVGMFNDYTYGLMILPCNSTNNLNPYGLPISYVLTGTGFAKQLSADEVVRCMDNNLAIPIKFMHIMAIVKRMAETMKTLDLNMVQQRMPYILVSSKNTEFSMKALQRKIKEGEHSVVVDKDMFGDDTKNIVSIPTLAPYLGDKLKMYLYQLENEILSYLGINNSNIASEGGRSYDETSANNELILLNVDQGLQHRMNFCDECNKKFGTNLSVEPSKTKIQRLFAEELMPQEDENDVQVFDEGPTTREDVVDESSKEVK